ncbi:MAG: acetyl-CoA carboxylase biotin carboxyl carrier protein [Candidatus Omnitrophica bacterium]|nr:acetyl-CoA carboxylase biotin carboxyl carrier protein [Candidatus Omnitrophota bacterium]
MNLKELKEMISLMNENELTELELERDGLRIKLKKGAQGIQEIITPLSQSQSGSEISQIPETKPKTQESIEIESPMVGTFYRAPTPEAVVFVDIGTEIAPGQVLCIIEAMKLMNEIKAEVHGRIKEILVENGSAVEYGQVLFYAEPI